MPHIFNLVSLIFDLYSADDTSKYEWRRIIAGIYSNANKEVRLSIVDFTADTLNGKRNTLNIGIVDDEPLIRELLQDQLEEQGHRVTCCERPQEMLGLLRRRQFDVILSDMKMPFMTGVEFYERVVKLYPRQAERIVFLSGDLMGAATRGFLERTGCLYLAKPFRQAVLLAKIEEAMQRSSLEEADWEVDVALPKAA